MPTPAEMMRLRLLAEAERRSPKGAYDVVRLNGDDSDHPLAWLTRPTRDGIAGAIHTAGTAVHGAAKAINHLNQDNTEDTTMPYPRRPASMQPRGGYDVDPDLDQTTGAPPDDGSAEQAVAGIQAIVEGLSPDQQSQFLAQLKQWIDEQQGGGGAEAPMAGDSRIAMDGARQRRNRSSFLQAHPGAASINTGGIYPSWIRRDL